VGAYPELLMVAIEQFFVLTCFEQPS